MFLNGTATMRSKLIMYLTRDIDPLISELESMQRDLNLCYGEDMTTLESADYELAMSIMAEAEFLLRALSNRIQQHALKHKEQGS
jgi:hypothetical protein